jgi:hypothetical protein
MFGLIARWWRWRQRRIDVEILWPAIRQQAFESPLCDPYGRARAAFERHMAYDEAWRDVSAEDRARIIDSLH